MGAPTNIYVDPSIASNTGTGTIGDPYGDLQYALDSTTRNSTDGDQFNIKAGTDEILTAPLDLTSYGTPTDAAPLIFRGYTTTANDGGIGGIDCGGSSLFSGTTTFCKLIHLHIHNGGTSDLVTLAWDSLVLECELHNTTGKLVSFGSGAYTCSVIGCHLYDGSYGVWGGHSIGNYFKNSGTTSFTWAISLRNEREIARGNIISIDGSSSGIEIINKRAMEVSGNSILSAGGSGVGIHVTWAPWAARVMNNVVEGFSGSGGKGIVLIGDIDFYANNAVYNCTTNYDTSSADIYGDLGDNETLASSPFAKSGSDTFANRFTYFEPADVGNVRGGAYPSGSRRDKGAVQHSDPTGGGGGGAMVSQGLHAIESGITA